MFTIRTKLLSTLKNGVQWNVYNILDVAKSSINNNRTLFMKTPSTLSVNQFSRSNNNSAVTSTFIATFQLGRLCSSSSNADAKDVNKNAKILMEFFDEPNNWPESEVKSGRAWKLDELRIKSNKELHQLWFVLLKERNMLLTMEHECNEKVEPFPSPERLDKVKLSMSNLETVVRERNRAYHLLETGETGERPVRLAYSNLGLLHRYRSSEHVLPPFMNLKWLKSRGTGVQRSRAVRKFLGFYREKNYNRKRQLRNRNRNEVMMLLRRDPNLNRALLRERYPEVNIDTLIRKDKTRGHFVPKIEY